MGRTWVLHTETKGTGAQMVPLDSITKRATPPAEPIRVRRPVRPRPKPVPAPAPSPARAFKVVDVMTRRVLAEGASTQQTVDVLKGVRRLVDVNVYVWQEDRERWRLLTYEEQRALLDLAHRQ